jgi:primosomal protein N' (replication factor Y)
MSRAIAKVAIESPLPQLDRLFDYEIPQELAERCVAGVRVLVPFGKSLKPYDGYVISVTDSADVTGELSRIQEVISDVPVLPAQVYELLRAIADRQAATLSDLTKLAIPKRSVRVEKAWLAAKSGQTSEAVSTPVLPSFDFKGKPASFSGKNTLIAEPRLVAVSTGSSENEIQGWIANFVAFALEQIWLGKSAVLVVPDFRDQNRLLSALDLLGLSAIAAHFSSDQTPSARYSAYLKCLSDEPVIVVGSRAAAYAPVHNLGGVALWDDTDQSLAEPTSPYLHTREVLLLRQQLAGCSLLIAGHSRSPEVQRLIEIGYLADISPVFPAPRIAVTEPGLRVDSTSYQAVRKAFESNGAVLVQVANTGHSTGTYCANCDTRSQCSTCHGPIFIADNNVPRCRWCAAININLRCASCHSTKMKQGSAGSQRTASELGKAFPGVSVVEATWQHRVESIMPGKRLVVATPGAEPTVPGGYSAVILLDGNRLLGKDTLRATEMAVACWSNAVSLMSKDGLCVGVGLASPLGQKFALWDQVGIAADELAGRRELGFPPHFRMASITGPRELVDEVVSQLGDITDKPGAIEVLGPLLLAAAPGKRTPNDAIFAVEQWRYLVRFEYSIGDKLATELKARALKVNASTKSVNASTGRASRAVKVKLDDSEVI